MHFLEGVKQNMIQNVLRSHNRLNTKGAPELGTSQRSYGFRKSEGAGQKEAAQTPEGAIQSEELNYPEGAIQSQNLKHSEGAIPLPDREMKNTRCAKLK